MNIEQGILNNEIEKRSEIKINLCYNQDYITFYLSAQRFSLLVFMVSLQGGI